MVRTLASAAVIAAPSAPARAQTCTRDSLKGFVAAYFKAAETHSMSALATAPNLRVTQNGLEITPGDGSGATMSPGDHLTIERERCFAMSPWIAKAVVFV